MTDERDLKELKNLGAASVNILHAVGINSAEDLRQTGAVEAFRRIRQRGIKVSRVMLYAMEGALLDIHWKELEPALKEQLVRAAEAEDH